MTVTTLEPTTIEHLDFDLDMACQSRFCPVDHPLATHIAIWHMTCGHYLPKLLCTTCAQRFKQEAEWDRYGWYCKVCHFFYTEPLRDLMEVRPL